MQLALEDGQLLGLPRLSGNTNDPNEEILFDSRKNSNSTNAYVPKPEETSSKPKPEPIAQNFCISSGVQTCAASEEEEEFVESLELFFFLLLSSSELFPFFRLSLTFLPDTPFSFILLPGRLGHDNRKSEESRNTKAWEWHQKRLKPQIQTVSGMDQSFIVLLCCEASEAELAVHVLRAESSYPE